MYQTGSLLDSPVMAFSGQPIVGMAGRIGAPGGYNPWRAKGVKPLEGDQFSRSAIAIAS